jgi:hypothetical protein
LAALVSATPFSAGKQIAILSIGKQGSLLPCHDLIAHRTKPGHNLPIWKRESFSNQSVTMKTIIGDWVGKHVSLTLKVGGIATAVTIEGTLIKIGEAGVLLELPKGRTFVPVAAILHISLMNDS